jgi:hypothetical protein
MLSRIKFDIQDLFQEILDQIPQEVFNSKDTTFVDVEAGGGQSYQAIKNKLLAAGHSEEDVKNRVTMFFNSSFEQNYAINKNSVNCNTGLIDKMDNMIGKFDVCLTNPPYQHQEVGNTKSSPVWHHHVEKNFSLVKENGYVGMIHPPQWRNPEGETKLANKILFENQLLYVSCHSYDEGKETFGVGTAYDWHVSKKIKPYKKTTVSFQDKKLLDIDLSNVNFLPSGYYTEIQNLIAESEEDRVEFISERSTYGNDKPHMAKTQDTKFKYPCIYTITKNDVNLWYTNDNKRGHFGKSKVIWSNGSGTRPIIDKEGKFGVMNFSYAICDKPENLKNIAKALESKKMLEIMKHNLFTNGIYNNTIIKMFKKDFWKDFI